MVEGILPDKVEVFCLTFIDLGCMIKLSHHPMIISDEGGIYIESSPYSN